MSAFQLVSFNLFEQVPAMSAAYSMEVMVPIIETAICNSAMETYSSCNNESVIACLAVAELSILFIFLY